MTTSEQETSVWTGAPYSEFHGVSIPKAVAAQAARRPDATAVAAGTEVLTYHDLDCRANRLARYLRSVGEEPGCYRRGRRNRVSYLSRSGLPGEPAGPLSALGRRGDRMLPPWPPEPRF